MNINDLKQQFPHGHPAFLPITVGELQLHSDKNWDYANGGPPLGNFDRVAAILALYPNLKLSDRRVVALVYALKQLDAVLWGINQNIVHKVEGLKTRLQDISVYTKLVMCMCDDDARFAPEPPYVPQTAAPQNSSQPCGCDPGANWVCVWHKEEQERSSRV